MDPIEELINEHVHIKSMLDVLASLTENKDNFSSKSLENMKICIEFLSIYADKLHHGKEEKILFFEIKDIEFFQNHQIINEIEDEHNQGRFLIREMKNTINDASAQLNEQIKDKLDQLAWDYIDLLSQHIEKEDKILFPAIREHLNANLTEKISNSFHNVVEEIGKTTIENQLKVLNNLKKLGN